MRKVLGATVPAIVAMLARDFVVLVAAAFLVAVPVAYFVMDQWLNGFAYRTAIGPDVFVITGQIVLAIALLTVSYQSIRAALTDPAHTLRYG